MTNEKKNRVRRCQAAVYHKDCYRVDRRAGVIGGFSMHYNRAQCTRPSVNQTPEVDPHNLASRPWAIIKSDYFCWQHEKIANRIGAIKPEKAAYFQYITESPS